MEDLPYRSPFIEESKPRKSETADERDLPTLVEVRDLLNFHISKMSSDFNAFDTRLSPEELYIRILARQEAHAILEPVSQAVEAVINKIYEKRK